MNRWTDILNHTKVIVLNEFYSIKKLNIILKNSIKKKKKKGKTLIKKIMKGSTRKRSSFRDSGKTPGRCCKLVDTKLRSLDTTKLFNN